MVDGSFNPGTFVDPRGSTLKELLTKGCRTVLNTLLTVDPEVDARARLVELGGLLREAPRPREPGPSVKGKKKGQSESQQQQQATAAAEHAKVMAKKQREAEERAEQARVGQEAAL